MCRSIQTLRPPYTDNVTAEDVRAAALQYVRKVAGMRVPSRANEEAFHAAVDEVAAASQRLLDALVLPPPRPRPEGWTPPVRAPRDRAVQPPA